MSVDLGGKLCGGIEPLKLKLNSISFTDLSNQPQLLLAVCDYLGKMFTFRRLPLLSEWSAFIPNFKNSRRPICFQTARREFFFFFFFSVTWFEPQAKISMVFVKSTVCLKSCMDPQSLLSSVAPCSHKRFRTS
jgi:hypothetical protein